MINGLPENSSALKPQRRGLIHWGLILNFALVNALSKQNSPPPKKKKKKKIDTNCQFFSY